MSDAEWIALIAPAREGDVAAIETLEQKLAPYAHCALLARVSHQVAASMVKGVLAQVLFRLHELPSPEAIGQRVVQLARERAIEAARSPGSTVEQADSDPLVTQGRRVLSKVRELPENLRERVLLRLLEGVPGFEIAEMLLASEAEVRADLERGVAMVVQAMGYGDVSLAADSYLWMLVGTPHPSLIPLENQLTGLRFDLGGASTADQDATPSGDQANTALGIEGLRPVGRRPTGESPREPSVGLGAQPPGPTFTLPSAAGANPFHTQVKTIGVADLPAAGAFEDSRAAEPSFAGSVVSAGPDTTPGTEPGERTEANDVPPHLREKPSQARAATVERPSTSRGVETKQQPRVSTPGQVPERLSAERPRVATGGAAKAAPVEPERGRGSGPRQTTEAKAVPGTNVQPLASEPVPTGGPSLENAEPTRTVQKPGPPPPEQPSETRPISLLARERASEPRRAQPPPQEDWRTAASLEAPPPPSRREEKPKGPTKGATPFFVAGALALVATGVIALLMSGTANAVKRGWTLVPVVVANAELPEGTRVTMEMVSTRAVPEQFVTSSVVKPDSISYVLNQELLVPVQVGDPLLWSQFETTKAVQRLSTRVTKRGRAITIDVDGSDGVGGWVQPNDQVDLIAFLRDPVEPEKSRAVTLLQNVTVLTTGKITPTTNVSLLPGSQRQYADVSLLLTPEEAEVLALAKDVADLRLTLRHEEDGDLRTGGGFSTSDTLLDGKRVRLLERKRFETIQLIRNAPLK